MESLCALCGMALFYECVRSNDDFCFQNEFYLFEIAMRFKNRWIV